ncbi:MAG: Ribbon-helix-helix protein, CopG family [Deltaproteobacteria bacterium]|nr:Ribbon-helix-helix protein, CopG family [Deltaproteobacteria bacterium]
MRQTFTIRLSKDLSAWLEDTAAKSGVSQGKLVRDQLEKARASNGAQAFMRLAGTVRGAKNLSKRKGFSRS